LRERLEDVRILIEHFVEKYSREHEKPFIEISKEAMKTLLSYPWPGNIRELENKIQQLVVMSTFPVIGEKDTQLTMNEPISNKLGIEQIDVVKGITSRQAEIDTFNVARNKIYDLFEKSYLTQLLTLYKGDMVRAAKKAGKSRTALWNLLKKQRLSPKQFR
ncbi:MAG: hypothetical protein GY941_13535, partial [Planctomycetes bacterium]|nr:hypothetical protein [Planctomycetota bacterium]